MPFHYHLLDMLGKDELRYHQLISSGAPLSELLLDRLKQQVDEVWQQYSCTEAGCISLGNQLTSSSDVGQPLQHILISLENESISREWSARLLFARMAGLTDLIH